MISTILWLFLAVAVADDTSETKLEQLATSGSTVYVLCFSETGNITRLNDKVVTEAMFITDSQGTIQEKGVRVCVEDDVRSNCTFVDYDEIEDLISGIEELNKIEPDNLPFPSFKAVYETRGALRVKHFSVMRGNMASVSSGRIAPVEVLIADTDLRSLLMHVDNARLALLEKPKEEEQPKESESSEGDDDWY
jgi:hypothetical protein